MEFGLTRQEASIYQCLLTEGKVTGYEVAKQTGISRSNAYNSLANMTEKGAAYLVEEGHTRKYVPVPPEEFCRNRIRKLEESRKWLVEHVPSEKTYVDGYITIEGAGHILDKVRNILMNVEERVYISLTRNYLLLLVGELQQLTADKKQVVIITDQPTTFGRAKVYIGEDRGMRIGVIADSRYVLTGEYGEGSMNTCLYSGQRNFVELYKTALSNEIKLLSMREENQ
ncbi:TrmB family transcriptional regulator [Lachnospiraceae bacterium 62-26]|nr:TrmB family transcriptional regulator [Dorea sp.]